ncbi:MAG: hypothetical protein J6X86_00760 [Bacteroidales bacterium]|nr:hypothetical protein [Bacteroidales bacterium]
MNHRAFRHIASIVLLAAYLPMLVASSLHIHHQSDETVDSDNYLQCTGHFEIQHHHNCDCQYCHFLGLNYLCQTAEESSLFIPDVESVSIPAPSQHVQTRQGVALLRAPPAV